jgi:ATP-dependent RNA helicase DeaD
MQDFSSLGLPEQLLNSLKLLDFKTPTPIQAKVIPDALKGRDILGSAQTGSGKTGAFGIPLVAKLMLNPQGSALVMTPTRELAMQVIKMLESLIGKNTNIKTALLIGGDSITKQFQKLRARPRLIVGTPGRINDHIARDTVKLSDVQFLVLDETDRMLDMGFTPQIDSILEHIPEERQTLLFSATLPKNIMSMSKKYLSDPLRVSLEEISKPVSTLKQEIINVSEQDKYSKLLEELETREGSVIIFVKTKMGVDRITKRLRQDDHSADAIHGDLSHNKREKAISGFRMCKYRILVATDIAARGLDIPHIMHVINYDLPQCPEDYIHRIGRTARAGAEGSALCLISPADKIKWKIINNLINFGESPEQEMGNRNFGNRSSGAKSFGSRNFRSERSNNGDQRKRFSFGNDKKSDDNPRSFNNSRAGERPRFGTAPRQGFSTNSEGSERPRFGSAPRQGFSTSSEGSERPRFGSSPRQGFSSDSERSERPRFGSSPRQGFSGNSEGGEKSFRSSNPKSTFGNSDSRKKTFRRTTPAA